MQLHDFCKRHGIQDGNVSPLPPAEPFSDRSDMKKILYLVRVLNGSEASRAKVFKGDPAIEEASVLIQKKA